MRKRTLKLPKMEVPATPQTLNEEEIEAASPPDLEDGLGETAAAPPEVGGGGPTTFEDWLKTPEGRQAVDPRFPTQSLARIEGHLIEILRLAWNRGGGL
jgi:hypothetical protein